jgi:hypothetical protein
MRHTATAAIVSRIEIDIFSPLLAQQRLYFCPLPQGQGSFRPMLAIDHRAP